MKCNRCGDPTPNPKFCSRSCAVAYNNARSPKRVRQIKVCKLTGCEEIVEPTRVYCVSHKGTLQATQRAIEAWLAGDNSITLTAGVGGEAKKFVKKYLMSVRGDKCEVCGFSEHSPDGRSIIQMDHIDGNYQNNDPSNLQLLCPNHHAMTPNYGSLNKNGGRRSRRRDAKGI